MAVIKFLVSASAKGVVILACRPLDGTVEMKPEVHIETLTVDGGELKFYFKLHTPPCPNPELPDPPYIFIDYIIAEPRRKRLLQRHAGEVIARIREKIGSDRPIIFQPANGEMGNDVAQAQLERYYLKCGFCYLPSSGSKWWMTWPSPPASTLKPCDPAME